MLKLTEKSASRIREIAEEEGIDSLIIRVKIVGGGCAGFQFDLYYEEPQFITDMDEQFEYGDVKVVCDQLSYQYLENTEIDYIESELGEGFKFNNPNISSACGCGNSYSF